MNTISQVYKLLALLLVQDAVMAQDTVMASATYDKLTEMLKQGIKTTSPNIPNDLERTKNLYFFYKEALNECADLAGIAVDDTDWQRKTLNLNDKREKFTNLRALRKQLVSLVGEQFIVKIDKQLPRQSYPGNFDKGDVPEKK